MRVDFLRADPTGNATILVLSPVAPSARGAVAARLMALDGGWAEQVGFISRDGEQERMDMMGGEFCGNASLSFAAYLAEARGLSEEELPLRVSGAPEAVVCSIRKNGEDWTGTLSMPLPESVAREEFVFGGKTRALWTVRFEGIIHVVVPSEVLSREEAEIAVRKWADDIGAPALGLLLFSERELKMAPLVYIRATDGAVWERGCASGTSAIGAYLAVSSGKNAAAAIRQPGGMIEAEARLDAENGRVANLCITGNVRLLGKDHAEI